MKLDKAKTVVAGGAGGVGEGLVRAFLKQGAHIVVPSRSESKLKGLREYVSDIGTGELITLVGSLSSPSDADALRDEVYKRIGEVDVAVASLGGWDQGPLITDVAFEVWERILRDNLTSHFLAMKAFVPLLVPQRGAYVHINGFSAEQPVPGAAPVAAMAAAQKSLALTLAEEVRPAGLRVYELILGPIKTRARLRYGHGQPEWFSPEEIGDRIVQLLERQDEEVLHRLMSKPK